MCSVIFTLYFCPHPRFAPSRRRVDAVRSEISEATIRRGSVKSRHENQLACETDYLLDIEGNHELFFFVSAFDVFVFSRGNECRKGMRGSLSVCNATTGFSRIRSDLLDWK